MAFRSAENPENKMLSLVEYKCLECAHVFVVRLDVAYLARFGCPKCVFIDEQKIT